MAFHGCRFRLRHSWRESEEDKCDDEDAGDVYGVDGEVDDEGVEDYDDT